MLKELINFSGIGYAAAVMAFWLNTHYIVVLAWALYYMWSSLTAELPWGNCNNAWNTPKCRSEYELARDLRQCTKYTTKQVCLVKLNTTFYESPVKQYWE